MDTAIYVALSRELGLVREMEVTANNIANVNTSGYQGQKLVFTDFLVPSSHKEGKVAFTNDVRTHLNGEQGTVQITNNPLNAAISGKGYFAVQTPLGERYTRNGAFVTNEAGELVTSEGHRVLAEDGQAIVFEESDRVIEIAQDGTVIVDNAERSKLRVIQFANEQLLERAGGSLLRSDIPPTPAENVRLVAGAVERSNVIPFKELTHMMYVSRSVADTHNMINALYSLSRKASDTLSKTS